MVVSSDSSSNDLSLEQTGTQKWKVMLGIGLGAFLFGLDIYIVNLALPILVESFHTNFATIQWVVISYVLMITIFVLSAARLGDMYSKKWLYLGGIILFSISSLFCGLAPSVGFLIGFRALQGLGAVFISALGAAIIAEVFPSAERGRALGIFSGIFVLGIALGPGVGGLLLTVGGWRLIFLVNVPVGLIASLIVAFAIPPSATKEEVGNSFKFDVIGALLLTVTLTCFAFAMTLIQISNWAASTEFILLAIAAISFACFLVVESRLQSPMLDLKLFRSPEFSLSLLLNCVAYVVIGALGLLLPFFLTLVKHYPPQVAGLLLMVFPIFSALISPIAGTVSDRFGERIVSLIGLLLMVCGCWAVSTLNSFSTMLDLVIRAGLLQMGMGTFYSSNSSIVMGSVPQEQLGIGSGLLSFSRIGGTMMGVSLLGALFSTLTSDRAVKILQVTTGHIDVSDAPSEALVFSLDATFAVTAVIVLVATILTAILWWKSIFGKSSEKEI